MIGNRLIVDTAVYDDFVDRFLKRARALTVGHPSDPQTDLWPIINSSQLQSIQDKIARARYDGAPVLLEGEPVGPSGSGFPPHVLAGDNDVATVARGGVRSGDDHRPR